MGRVARRRRSTAAYSELSGKATVCQKPKKRKNSLRETEAASDEQLQRHSIRSLLTCQTQSTTLLFLFCFGVCLFSTWYYLLFVHSCKWPKVCGHVCYMSGINVLLMSASEGCGADWNRALSTQQSDYFKSPHCQLCPQTYGTCRRPQVFFFFFSITEAGPSIVCKTGVHRKHTVFLCGEQTGPYTSECCSFSQIWILLLKLCSVLPLVLKPNFSRYLAPLYVCFQYYSIRHSSYLIIPLPDTPFVISFHFLYE